MAPKILIVEDDPITAVFLEELIAETGIGFVWLQSGDERLVTDALAKHHVIGVFQDWAGPSRGLENAQLFGKRGIPVVIVSASKLSVITTSLEAVGTKVEAILQKPPFEADITNAVTRWREKATAGK